LFIGIWEEFHLGLSWGQWQGSLAISSKV